MAHASAVLAGLVFVALELNSASFFKDATQRTRAIGTMTGFMVILLVSGLALMGEQTDLTLGGGWALVAGIGLVIYLRGLFDNEGTKEPSGIGVNKRRVTLGILTYLGQIGGALLLMTGSELGLYLAASFMLLSIVYLVSGAWLLFVGSSMHKHNQSDES